MVGDVGSPGNYYIPDHTLAQLTVKELNKRVSQVSHRYSLESVSACFMFIVRFVVQLERVVDRVKPWLMVHGSVHGSWFCSWFGTWFDLWFMVHFSSCPS